MNTADYSVELYTWDRYFIEQYFDTEQQVSKINIAGPVDMEKYLNLIGLSGLGNPSDLG